MSGPPVIKHGANLARYTDVITLVVKAPRTVPAIAEMTGYTRNTIQRYIDMLRAEGLVHIFNWVQSDKGGPRVAVWGWQATPFVAGDMPRPKALYYAQRKRLAATGGEDLS